MGRPLGDDLFEMRDCNLIIEQAVMQHTELEVNVCRGGAEAERRVVGIDRGPRLARVLQLTRTPELHVCGLPGVACVGHRAGV